MNKIGQPSSIPEPPPYKKPAEKPKTARIEHRPSSLERSSETLDSSRVTGTSKRENVLLFWGYDDPVGPINSDLREGLEQKSPKIVVDKDIVDLLLKPVPLDRLNEIAATLEQNYSNIGKSREFIDREVRAFKSSYQVEPSSYFKDYDVFVHTTGSYVVFRLKGDKPAEESSNPSFKQVKSLEELAAHLSKQDTPFSLNVLLDAFPDVHPEGMTLFIAGHGIDSHADYVAGMPTEGFKQFIEALDQREHPDCVLVSTCFGGGKKHIKLFSGANELEKVASKTTYVVSGVGSTVGFKSRYFNFDKFFKEMDAVFAKEGVVKKNDLVSPLDEIGMGGHPVNTPMVRFPNVGKFQQIQDGTTFNVNANLISKKTISRNRSIDIPTGLTGIVIDAKKVPLRLVLDVQDQPILFFNRDHPQFAIDEIHFKKGDFAAFAAGFFGPLLQYMQSEGQVIYIGKVTFEDGTVIHDVKIMMPGYDAISSGSGQPPLIGFYDSENNFYLNDITMMDPFRVSNPNWDTIPGSLPSLPSINPESKRFYPMSALHAIPVRWREFQSMTNTLQGFPYDWRSEVDAL